MRLHRLKLVNFRLHADTDLAVGHGITAIVGPNGAGKTTLLEALAWAFYGTPAARGSRESIRRHGAPPRARVRVEAEFSLGAHEYRVVRHLYGAELYQDGATSPIANSQQAVSGKIGYLFGMNREEFFNTYFTGQKELAVMASMGPSERAKFLSRLLGYEKLKLAQDELRTGRSALRGEVAGMERGLENEATLERDHGEASQAVAHTRKVLADVVAAAIKAREELQKIEPSWVEIQRVRDSILSLEGERAMAEQQVREARRDFERLDQELAQAMVARDRLKSMHAEVERVERLRTECEALDRAGRDAGERRALSGKLQEVQEQLTRLDTQLQEFGDLDELIDAARSALAASQRDLDAIKADEDRLRTTWVRDKQDAETKRQSLRDQYLDVQRHQESIMVAGSGGKCPTCARELGDEFETVLKTLGRQLEEIESNGKFYRQRIDQLQHEPSELVEAIHSRETAGKRMANSIQRLAQAESRMRAVADATAEHGRLCQKRAEIEKTLASLTDGYDADRHDALRAQLRAAEQSARVATELAVRAERAEALVSEAEAAEKELSDRETRVAHLTDAIAASGFSDATYADLKEKYERAERQLRTGQLREASVNGDLKAAEATLRSVDRRRQEWSKRMKRIGELRRDLTLHDELDGAFEDLRTELNARLRPDLSELASALLADLTDGRYNELEIDEQYRINVVEDGLTKPVLSGGEEDVANLVLRLAISQMVSDRAGQPLSLLVLDEIFGGLDEGRRQNVVQLLRGLANRFPQVILITHIESVKQWVDRVLRVEVDTESGVAAVSDEDIVVPEAHAAA